MRVLFLTKYGPLAASTRYRSLQFFDYLREQGIECQASPLFGDGYLRKLFATSRSGRREALISYFKRFAVLTGRVPFDCAVVHIELFPYMPPLGEVFLRCRIPYLYDMDDAFFHNY